MTLHVYIHTYGFLFEQPTCNAREAEDEEGRHAATSKIVKHLNDLLVDGQRVAEQRREEAWIEALGHCGQKNLRRREIQNKKIILICDFVALNRLTKAGSFSTHKVSCVCP
jgi:hypothetical protein